MIYLAILLILCGLLIVITALSVETGIVNASGDLKSGGKNRSAESNPSDSGRDDFKSEDVEIIFPEDAIDEMNIDFDNEPVDLILPESVYADEDRGIGDDNLNSIQKKVEPDRAERRKLDSTGRPDIIEKRENSLSGSRNDDGSVSAVMYDDRSNIIDYESGTAVIDTTLSKYKSIKRIGKGTIDSDYDGVSFYLDERLYRFDFHKVYDIWSGSNYVALPLKGNSTVKLFIIENSTGFPGKVESNFKEYEKGL